MKRFNWQSWAGLAVAVWAATVPTVSANVLGTGPGAALDWFTFLGGTADDYGNAVAVDTNSATILVAGTTFSDSWTTNTLGTNYNGSRDAFVAKLDTFGTVLWSTYLGGSSDDQATGLAVDGAGNTFVVGHTRSRGWARGGADTTYHDNGAQDVFVSKLSPAGALLWTTLLGGTGFEYGWGIVLDHDNNILVTGSTMSTGWARRGAITNNIGGQDAFVAKLSPANGSNIWTTHLGGNSTDAGRSIAVDSANNIYVTGETLSSGWVRGVAGTTNFGTNFNGNQDVFVAKLSPTNGATIWSTYLGGKDVEQSFGLAVDHADNVLVCGFTTSSNWLRGGFSTNLAIAGGQDAFVAKFSPLGAPLWSTYLGGLFPDSASALAVDATNSVYVTGYTRSPDWTSGGFTNIPNALRGVQDGFVVKISPTGAHLWSSSLGGDALEGGAAIAYDPVSASVFVTGFSTSTNWVSTFGATNYTGAGILVAKLQTITPPACFPLATPALVGPGTATQAAPQTNGVWNPTLTWQAVTNASDYVVQLFAISSNLAWPIFVSPLLPPALTNFTLPNNFLYDRLEYAWSVQAFGDGTAFCDSAPSGFLYFSNNITDRSGPWVSITNFPGNARFTNTFVTNATITIGGQSGDNIAVKRVYWAVQYGAPSATPVPTNQLTWIPAAGTTNWHADVPLMAGTNTVRVFSEDTSGNDSGVTSVTFYYVVASPITINTAGYGIVSLNGVGNLGRTFTTNNLEVGRSYTVNASPQANTLFSNWVGTSASGLFVTNIRSLNFVMQTNLVLTANFVTNQFSVLQGTYNGLFGPANFADTGVTNAGYFTLSLGSQGAFSGKLLIAGESLPFTGTFAASNTATLNVLWSPVLPEHFGLEPLAMNLDLDPVHQVITGSLRYNTWWQVGLVSDLAVPTNAFQGNYTLLMSGSADPVASPIGLSAATVTVDSRANLTLSGTLADGSPLSQSTTVGTNGLWPLYASPYNGHGLLTAWMGLNTNNSVLWIKQPVTNDRYYSNGFTLVSSTALERYAAPTGSQRPVSWTNALAIIGGGNLPGWLTNQIAYTNNQLRSLGGSISNLSLSLSTGNGSFTGSFLPPGSRTTANVKGVLLQTNSPATFGGGWFLGTNQSGFFIIVPTPPVVIPLHP